MTTSLAILCAGIMISTASAQSPPFPFASVALRGDIVVATLPSTGTHWLVRRDSQQPRVTTYGESFQLRDGASLMLTEKHSSYRITCHIMPPPAGVQVESTFSAQSFGGTATNKSYFIKAQ